MGMNAFLTLPGIKGSARQKHVLGKIVVAGVDAQVGAELNWKTGRPEKGKNKHRPMVITKDIDLASPALHTALDKGTRFDVVTLELWRMPPSGGTEENYYTIVMNGVQVVGIKTIMVNNRRPENQLIPEQEEVSLSYETIIYGFKSGGKPDGTDATTSSKTEVMQAEFDIPSEAKIKELAIDVGKDAGKFVAGEVYSLWKGGEPK
jgi:type VI secretion system Hcp family effector